MNRVHEYWTWVQAVRPPLIGLRDDENVGNPGERRDLSNEGLRVAEVRDAVRASRCVGLDCPEIGKANKANERDLPMNQHTTYHTIVTSLVALSPPPVRAQVSVVLG